MENKLIFGWKFFPCPEKKLVGEIYPQLNFSVNLILESSLHKEQGNKN